MTIRSFILLSVAIGGCAVRGTRPTIARTPTPASSAAGASPSNAPVVRCLAATSDRVPREPCVCYQPALCDDPPCSISYDDNVASFRAALAGRSGERAVHCEAAELGVCGHLQRYFYVDGDIHRTELRFFDASGAWVGEIATTDDSVYCGRRANVRVSGAIPDCVPKRTELLCGTPIDVTGLLGYARAPYTTAPIGPP